MPARWPGRTVLGMAIQTGTRARQLTILRAAALFDGATTRLTATPVVVIDERLLVAVQTVAGGNLTEGSSPHEPQFEVEFLTAVVEEAHRQNLPVTAHAHAAQSIADAVAAGVDGIEHATFMTADGVDAPDHVIQAIVERRIAIGWTVGREPGHSGTRRRRLPDGWPT